MSSSDTPELEFLPFYQCLVKDFSDLYSKAQDSCSLIVIPTHLSSTSSLTRDSIESHLYRPSPLYKRKHVSWNGKLEIELDDNRTIRVVFKTMGVGERRVKVIDQEDVRDSLRKRSYSILMVDQPLVESITTKSSLNGFTIGSSPIKTISPGNQPIIRFNGGTASYASSFLYLDSVRPIEPAFTRLRDSLLLFNETYVILPKYIQDAIDKLQNLWSTFVQDSCQLLNLRSSNLDIELASEIYITGYAYTKLWPIILEHTENKDQILLQNIRKRQVKQQKNSTLNFNASSSALSELKKLDFLKSAYEKAQCIRSTLDLTLAATSMMVVDKDNSSVTYRPSTTQSPMAADETLTAFIDLMCHLLTTSDQSFSLAAHEFFTVNFKFTRLPQHIEYAFTTYQAALEFLTSNTSLF